MEADRVESRYPRIGSHRSVEEFAAHLAALGPEVPFDAAIASAPASPLAEPLRAGRLRVANRWAIHPMEGWDGGVDGNPGPLTIRRWENFGRSGAKLIWGGEAVAVEADGRANPNQLYAAEHTRRGLADLRRALVASHTARFGSADGLVVGLQLTHSGRFSRPERGRPPEPRVAFRHPLLDGRSGVLSDAAVLTDGEIEGLVSRFARAARWASEAGYDFVDLKHCHGYLLHEFLGAHTRLGRYGGSFANRTRLLREIVAAVRGEAPGLEVAVRLSAFDVVPFRPDPSRGDGGRLGPGVPMEHAALLPYRFGFGVDPGDPTRPALAEPVELLGLLRDLGVVWVNVSGGSPYYSPHVQRPALYPPSDGYEPPEDPLAGVVRQLRVARELKRAFPELVIVGSALSYLQEFLPHVAQGAVRAGWLDVVGIGRMALSYWDLPVDVLERGSLDRRRLCRTFSECTTAPRHGLASGCYPLDPFYKALPEAAELREIRRGRRGLSPPA